MKLEVPENENYAATVVSVEELRKLTANEEAQQQHCDNVVGLQVNGLQAIVSKDTAYGTIGILFSPETQLSEDYVKNNNLYRHSEKNKDPEKAGYIEDNRRVKAVRFRGHKSNALFMPLSSLAYTGVDINELKVGDVFDQLNGHEICKKFVRKVAVPRTEKNKHKVFKRVDEKFLPEHYDTDNYWRNKHTLKGNQQVIVTQKLHGTSIRIGNTIVARKLTKRDKIAKLFGAEVKLYEFDHVYGSRKSIKDPNNPNQNHYYEMDLYSEEGRKYDELIPENFIVYGELIGWLPTGAAIQKNYTYAIPHGENELYVYRVAIVTNQGLLVDLSWNQVKEFCRDRGLKYVPELWKGMHKYFDVDEWIDKKYAEMGIKDAVPLAKESPVDEGVCVRVDGIAPYILKAKSPLFFEHETKMLDEEAPDIEEEEKQLAEAENE